jgi:cytochrome P450
MNRSYPPGPDGGLFGMGNTIQFQANALGFLETVAHRYGDICFFQMGANGIYLLNHPDLVQEVFVTNAQKLQKPEILKQSNRGYWGDGLTSLQGEIWKTRRRLMQPAFHHHRIAAYAQTIVNCTREMLAGWQQGERVNLDREFLILTARISARVLFDAELEGYGSATENQKRAGLIPLEEALGEAFTVSQGQGITNIFSLTRLRANPKMEATLHLIQQCLTSGEDRGDMLSFLISARDESGMHLEPSEIIGEILQMFFAGHHTIPTSLIWLFYSLSQNAEIETQFQEELDRVLGKKLPDAEKLRALGYGQKLVKETLRFYAPNSAIVREIVAEIPLEHYTLRPGTQVWVSPYLLHRDPRNFPHPERFWPDRFAKENAQHSKYAYLPFGVEPRLCIGNEFSLMQIQLISSTIAQGYRLTLEGKANLVPKAGLTIRPDRELLMRVGIPDRP